MSRECRVLVGFALALLAAGCNFKSFGPSDYSGRWPAEWPAPLRAFIEIRADSTYNQLFEEKPGGFITHNGRWTRRPSTSGPQVILLDAALWDADGYPRGGNADVPIRTKRSWGNTTLIYDTDEVLHWLVGNWSRQSSWGREDLDLHADSTYTQRILEAAGAADTLYGRWSVSGARVLFREPIDLCSGGERKETGELQFIEDRDRGRTVLHWKPDEPGYERVR